MADIIAGDVFDGPINSSFVGGRQNRQTINNYNMTKSDAFANASDWIREHVAANALSNSAEVTAQPKCHEGTRIAILDHLISWAAALSYTYSVTWVHGPAGSGKSTILRTVARSLFEQGLLLASFFFFRQSAGRNSSERFIPTIAYQLAQAIPATRPFVIAAIESNPLLSHASLWDQAKALVIDPLCAVHDKSLLTASHHPRVLVIDGLDECGDPKMQEKILEVLTFLLESLPWLPFAILLASRPEHHIRLQFDASNLNRISTRISLHSEYQADADIRAYLSYRFKEIRLNHPLKAYIPAQWPPEGVIGTLVVKASGQFIYASTVDKFISSSKRNPAKQLSIILTAPTQLSSDKPFQQLDILYHNIFSALKPSDIPMILRIIGLILIFQTCEAALNKHGICTPKFIEQFTGLEAGEVRRFLFDLASLLAVGRDDEEIQIFHASLSDFLFDESRSGQLWINAGLAYAEITEKILSHPHAFSHFLLPTADILTFISNATPTPTLHSAIWHWSPFGLGVDDHVSQDHILETHKIGAILVVACLYSRFEDAEQPYREKRADYLRFIQSVLQTHFESPALRKRLIILHFPGGREVVNAVHTTIFDPQDSSTLEKLHAGNLYPYHCWPPDYPPIYRILRDAFEDKSSLYLLHEHDYADCTLALLRTMESWAASPRFNSRLDIADQVAEILALVLLKSSVSRCSDLAQYLEKFMWSESYLYQRYPNLKTALRIYGERVKNVDAMRDKEKAVQ